MTKFVESRRISLNEAGKDENWLHQWIAEDPARLGIGVFDIENQEVRQVKNSGGRLDILGYNKGSKTYFEIEVMLGECDSDHGFRTLDYWAREKAKNPEAFHYAVLVAENLQGRYKTLIETLPLYLPFIGIEIQTLIMETEAGEKLITCKAEIITQPDDLLGTGSNIGEKKSPKDEEWWQNQTTDKFVTNCKEMHSYLKECLSGIKIDFTSSGYVSLKKGRRVFAYINPRQDGFYVSVPDDGTGADAESKRFEEWKEKLKEIDLDLNWVKSSPYSPIGFNLPRSKMTEKKLLDFLIDTYSLL